MLISVDKKNKNKNKIFTQICFSACLCILFEFFSLQKTMPLRWKEDANEYIPLIHLIQRVQFLKAMLSNPEGRPITEEQLKRVQDEIEDFKRFLNFHKINTPWMEFLNTPE